MSIKKILVPTDFSEVAKKALKVAATIAGKTNAEIHLLNVVHVPVIDPYTPAETINTIREEEEKTARQELAKMALEAGAVAPQIHIKIGFAVDEIVNFADEQRADLIVLGTAGASGLEETLLGSNASGVVDKAKVPVLCIPNEMKEFAANDIVYASDLEKNDITVISRLLEIAKLFNSTFHIVHIRNNDLPLEDTEPKEIFEAIVAATGYHAMSFHEVKNENTSEGIIDFIEKSPCDILAMAIYHRGFFSKLFHRSLTKRMVNHSHIPVLTYYKEL